MFSTIRNVLFAAICGVALLSTGCATGPQATVSTPKSRTAKKPKLICVRDAPTGSHITQMVCYRNKEVEDRRQTDQDKMTNMRIGGGLQPPNSQRNN